MNVPLVFPRVTVTLSFQHVKRTVVCLLLLAASVVVNFFFHDNLMALSIDVSRTLQTYNWDLLAITASTATTVLAILVIPVNAFLSTKKLAAFRMVVGLVLCSWVHGLTKLLYQDQRPSFLSTDLREGRRFFCEKEYGMPSGHSIFSAYAFFCIANQYKKYYFAQRLAVQFGVYLLIVLFALSVLWSRLYFGVHSLNQVVMGVLIGTAIFTLTNFSKAHLEYYLLKPVFRLRDPRWRLSLPVLIAMGMTLMTLAQALAFQNAYVADPEDSEFYRRIVNCTWVKSEWQTGFAVKVFKDGLSFLFFAGIILGISLNPRRVLVEFSFYFDRNRVNVFLRLCCVVLINLPALLLLAVPTTNLYLIIGRPLVLYPIFGVLTGRYALDLIEYLGIPLARDDPLSPASPKRDTDIVHI